MAEIVNLKQHRKRKARSEKDASADANRVKHGTPKRLRDLKKRDDEQAARHIDAHKLDDEES
jgi:hypothetical protein